MATKIEGYFDYRSPFPFLALNAVSELSRRYDAESVWTPIRLTGLSTYQERPMGHTLPKRAAYIAFDMHRWARRRGVSVKTPEVLLSAVATKRSTTLGRDHPLDTERLLRGAVVARDFDVFEAYLDASFRAVWERGEDPGAPKTLAGIVAEIGAPQAPFLEAVEQPQAGESLTRSTQLADDRGVFGVPTFFVGDEMFWGQDRLDFVEEALARR